jgi:hypothetical protein
MSEEGVLSKLTYPWKKLWSSTWSRREKLNGGLFPLEVFFIGILFIAIPYFGSNNIANLYLQDAFSVFPEHSYDRSIPVINWMIIPYSALYLFYPATLILAPRTDKGRLELLSAMQMLILATLFCVIFFLLFPAEIDMRDAIDWNSMNGVETILFEFIHTSDQPWNAWPSLHIVHSYCLARVMTHWLMNNYSETKWANYFLIILWVEWVLLCISILTTKQHYMFDLFSGMAVGFIAWKIYEPTLAMIQQKGSKVLAEEIGWSN